MMHGKAVLALWLDVDPAAIDECDDWYINRHIADRIAVPGWRRVRRFQAIQDTRPATLALYDVDSPEALVSEAYLRLQRDVDATDKRMRATFSNVVRDTFHVLHSAGTGEGGLMLTLRFQPDAATISGDAVALAIKDEIIPALSALHGVVGVHLLRQAPELRAIHDGQRKSGSDDAGAPWVLLVEATREHYAQRADKLLRCWPDGQVLGLCNGETGLYALMYAV
jgi:hypothetical protein